MIFGMEADRGYAVICFLHEKSDHPSNGEIEQGKDLGRIERDGIIADVQYVEWQCLLRSLLSKMDCDGLFLVQSRMPKCETAWYLVYTCMVDGRFCDRFAGSIY